MRALCSGCREQSAGLRRISSRPARAHRDQLSASARMVARAGQPHALAAGGRKGTRKKPMGTALRCQCGHPKSIHERMYANSKLGTPCNFPECRCKAYKVV